MRVTVRILPMVMMIMVVTMLMVIIMGVGVRVHSGLFRKHGRDPTCSSD